MLLVGVDAVNEVAAGIDVIGGIEGESTATDLADGGALAALSDWGVATVDGSTGSDGGGDFGTGTGGAGGQRSILRGRGVLLPPGQTLRHLRPTRSGLAADDSCGDEPNAHDFMECLFS